MISKKTLKKAAEKNIISHQQIEPLYQFIQNEKKISIDINSSKNTQQNLQEPLRFVRSFGDIFITLGIFIIVISINMTSLNGYYYLIPIAVFILIAEWLVRLRRLVLPGIAILISILFFINKAFLFYSSEATFLGFNTTSLTLTSISCLLFYIRYNMPFSLLPLAASLVTITLIQIGSDILKNPIIFVIPGFIIFCFAMWFDIRDTKRQSYLSDSAFWLHLIAAPLIVHGAMIALLSSDQSITPWINRNLMMGIFFACFFLIALFIDRRAILISTQIYAIYALTQLFSHDLIDSKNVMIYVLMALGMVVIFFGTYWYKTRNIIFSPLRNNKISRYVPDLNIQDNKSVN